MGEYADMILDGLVCQECGSVLEGGTSGVPQCCPDCSRDHYDRAEQCEATFDDARNLGAAHGFKLTHPGDGVYQLRHAGMRWIWNLYPKPGKAHPRIYGDKNQKGPFLAVPRAWTFMDVVQAAIKELGKNT